LLIDGGRKCGARIGGEATRGQPAQFELDRLERRIKSGAVTIGGTVDQRVIVVIGGRRNCWL
jgi:hypothetical protein